MVTEQMWAVKKGDIKIEARFQMFERPYFWLLFRPMHTSACIGDLPRPSPRPILKKRSGTTVKRMAFGANFGVA